MNKIVFPLKFNMQGPQVADLHSALLALLDRAFILPGDEGGRQAAAAALQSELAPPAYGNVTGKLVSTFQGERALPVTGDVDEKTANAFNKLLADAGLLDLEHPSAFRLVTGFVRREDGLPLQGARVRATHVSVGREIRLADDSADAEGRYTIRYDALPGAGGVNLKVSAIAEDGRTIGVSAVITNAKIVEIVDLTVPLVAPAEGRQTIRGTILLEHGQPAESLKLRLYRREFGGKATLLDEATTVRDGHYALSYDAGGRAASLEVRAVTPDGKEVSLSKPLNNLTAETRGRLNLLAPRSLQPLAAEYRRLSADLIPQLTNMQQLKDAREDAEQQDLSVLNRATGWDARLIALASVTERLAADPDMGLPSEALYGLLRAGLPSDKLLLAQLEPDVVETALKKVRAAGIVDIDDPGIAAVKTTFTEFANKTRLAMPIPGSRSTYGDLLKSSGLSSSAQDKFAAVYLKHRGDGAHLWEEARKVGLEGVDVAKLQLQGKLAFLAGNSEAMTTRLLGKGLKDPSELAGQGFFSAAAWKTELFDQAGIPNERRANPTGADLTKLSELIPAIYGGEEVEARLDAYAEDMARKVRLSYPTQVLGRLMETDQRFKLSAGHDATVKLLRNATERGFRLGETPVTSFLFRPGVRDGLSDTEFRDGLSEAEFREASEQMKMVQRVYQITPSNEAMAVLMSLGMTSAFDVTAYPEDRFSELFNAAYEAIHKTSAPSGEPQLVRRKAQQVSSVTYNLFAIARMLDSEPAVAGISAPLQVRESVRNELIKHFPTMESLFGSMDYCECDHCRSVLSPAAYLVDLLQFVDTEPAVWGDFLTKWRETHGSQDYPHKDSTGIGMKPYDVLIERRPDLPHIALTCENTHTAMPYIDIVNEILEYYVANGKLAKEAARDTGDATTAELLAEPQNVIREAYDTLRSSLYPLNLPFDLWLETVRKFCDYFETPLHRVLEVLRPDEDVFASIQNPTNVSNATVSVGNADAAKLSNGMSCTYLVASTNALSGEAKQISAIGAADSGGAGQTTITFLGTWASAPVAGDRLVSRPLDRRAAIFMESLGLSPAEVDIFTDPDPLASDKWHGLYGLPSVRVPIQSLTNAGNATLRVSNSDAGELRSGLAYAYFDGSSNALSSESKIIASIGASESGGAGQTLLTLDGSWTTPPVAGDLLVCDASAMLMSAKALSRRLGVTYKEITEIVQCDFVNPELSKLSLLYRLAVSVRDAKLYTDEKAFYDKNHDLLGVDRGTLSAVDQQRFDNLAKNRPSRGFTGWQVLSEIAAFEQRLADLAAAFEPPLNVVDLRNAIVAIPFDRVLVLADPDTGCNFDQTTLQYADGKKADAIVFLRINLFVRLWRKLGWSIEETDRALTAFIPLSTPFDGTSDNLTKQPLRTALIYLAHLKALDEKLSVGKQSRLKLLTLWSNIPTDGKKPLYAQLFLNRSVLKSSPVFDHPIGQYLRDLTINLNTHVLALQGALGLTAEEIGRILSDAGEHFDTASLSLENVSNLYRYGLLAKALRLSVRELIALKQLSGLDPFRQLLRDPLVTLDQDHPFVQTLEFVKVAEEVKDSGLKIEDLDYLLRHRFDDTGKYRPNREAVLSLIKSLLEGVRAIRAEHSMLDAQSVLSDDVLRQKLGLALPPDVVERFLGMVNTTAEFTATMGDVEQIDPMIFAAEERIRHVRYKEVPRKEQTLTVRGVLADSEKRAMLTRFDAVLNSAQKQTFSDLLNGVERRAREFFDNHLRKQALRLDGEAGFLEDADFHKLFAPLEPLSAILSTDTQAEVDQKRAENERIEGENIRELQKRRHRIGQAFLPILQQRLIRQFILQTMTAHTGADPVLVESLVADERLLAAPKALLDSFVSTADRGLDVTFWLSADASGVLHQSVTSAEANTGARDSAGKPLKPAGAQSARLETYLEVPITGAYRFYVELEKKDAEAELRFPHLPDPVLVKGTAGKEHATLGEQPKEYLELKAGVLYRMSLELKHLNSGDARLLVQGETVPKGPLSQLRLYPAATIDAAEHATTLLSKTLQMVQSLTLSEREIRYMLTHAADFDGMTLSDLPTATVGDSPAEYTSSTLRFGRFRRLAAYVRLKRELAGGTDDLLGIFESNAKSTADRPTNQIYSLIAKLVRRDEAIVKASAETLVQAPAFPAFESERPLWRLWETLQVVERFGVPPARLLEWSSLLNSGTTGVRRFELARDAKEAIKARFEPETWQRVAQPIFDKLRSRQRDALVSNVMHQHGFDRMEQIYEYFLVDPGMEPVVQTSRIRLAIASLQLFIQRTLLNLEPKVHPSTINAKQWEWMQRYRVWEANRKIFLFPENWLEPEFRDDKTHLFTELEGALLQGDVSSDLVEDAFFTYLKKLDELARLDICAMHIEDNSDPALRTLHVFGRTYSQPHKYFYRRYAHQIWTPWEPVSAEIEGDHLAPVVWRDRLYLFWVTFTDQADPIPSTGTATGTKKLTDVTLTEVMTDLKAVVARKQVDVQLHWSEYINGDWNTRESGGFSGVITRTVPTSFSRSSVFVHVSKEFDPADGSDLGVLVNLGGLFNAAFYVAGRNSVPEVAAYKSKPANPFTTADTETANRYLGSGSLKVSFRERITTEPGKTPPPANPDILKTGGSYTVLPCNNRLTPLGISKDSYLGAANPSAVEAAIKTGLDEIATLMKPVFYQDNRHTFFVEPDVTERTIEEWQEWVTRTPVAEPGLKNPEIFTIPEFSRYGQTPRPDDPLRSPIDHGSLINPVLDQDWLINPGSVIRFGDVLIGPTGQPGIEIRGGADPAIGLGRVNVNPGSDLVSGSSIVLRDAESFALSGLREIAGGFNVVGGAGLNAALKVNLYDLNRSGLDAGAASFGRMER